MHASRTVVASPLPVFHKRLCTRARTQKLKEREFHFFAGLGKAPLRTTRIKRTPTGFTARGFHEEVFDRDFGHFSPVKRSMKRRPEGDAAGFYGDTFSNGFGEFETMKRARIPAGLAQVMKQRNWFRLIHTTGRFSRLRVLLAVNCVWSSYCHLCPLLFSFTVNFIVIMGPMAAFIPLWYISHIVFVHFVKLNSLSCPEIS